SSARSTSFTSTRSRSFRRSSAPSPKSTKSCAACPTTTSDQLHLHERMKRIVDALPEVRAIFLINRDGRPLVSSRLTQIPADFDSRERSFFAAQTAGDAGTYVSEILTPRLTGLSTPFFVLSRRRPSTDGAFNGVVAVAVLPQYFEEFYALIGRSPGSLYALLRADGRF